MFQKIAVIGSGVMGHGIAQVYGLAGFDVSLYDLRRGLLDRARENIENSMSVMVTEAVKRRDEQFIRLAALQKKR
jgi:3-hydroxybutyryl-CoA dehydrogenase